MSATVEKPVSSSLDSQNERTSIYRIARRKSGFSFRSSLSFRRSNTTHTPQNQQSHEKKAKQSLPKSELSMTMLEELSSPVASEMNITLAPLRAIQHRDIYGNPISEPDRSNPTRSRWERPLDTIRSFEAAVNGSYVRQTQMRNEMNGSRRNSFQFAHQVTYDNKSRHRPHTYYGRSSSPMEYSKPVDNPRTNHALNSNRIRSLRPDFDHSNDIYSVPDVQESNEYVDSATSRSSSSIDPAYTTGPSSKGSSFDRISPTFQKDHCDTFDSKAPPDGSAKNQIETSNNQHHNIKSTKPIQALPELSSQIISKGQTKIDTRETTFLPVALATGQPIDKRRSWFSKRLSRVS